MTDTQADERERTRVVFFGTPEFAVPTVTALARNAGVNVTLVVTRPDRPAGRKRRLQAPPVKVAAELLGLPVLQPESLRDATVQSQLRAERADVFVVAAFGRIFGGKTLGMPRLGCLNLHASILPAYRGASPIAAAILQGDERTGVSLMKMERGLDTGSVLATIEERIKASDTTVTLTSRLAERAATLLEDAFPSYVEGRLPPVPQLAGATVTRPLTKEDGEMDWSQDAVAIERQVRAMWPWPRAWTTVPVSAGEAVMQVHGAEVVHEEGAGGGGPGQLVSMGDEAVVRCGADALRLKIVQLPGGRPQPFATVARTLGLGPRTQLGADGAVRVGQGLVQPMDGS
ncbi:MAG: methionyl-tRNA formyltransferase [Thermomicrobiales bacterium]